MQLHDINNYIVYGHTEMDFIHDELRKNRHNVTPFIPRNIKNIVDRKNIQVFESAMRVARTLQAIHKKTTAKYEAQADNKMP